MLSDFPYSRVKKPRETNTRLIVAQLVHSRQNLLLEGK